MAFDLPNSARFAMQLFCACILLFDSNAHAASSTRLITKSGSPVLISADSTFGDYEKQTIRLTGNVQMTFDGQNLRADEAVMDKLSGKITAIGNVILASPSAYVEGTQAEISYEDSTGVILDGFVKAGQVIFQGKRIRKLGPDQYEADEAAFTACTTCPAAWQFRGTKIKAEMGAYARISDANFYLGGQWVFWLPYLVVPLKSERQSGVLFPTYDIDSEGFGIGLPLFWAISRSQDMTVTPKWYTQRGFKGILNYRYILNEDSAGEMTLGGFLRDKVFSSDSSLNPKPGDERSGRWFINHDHIYTLPGGFINRARLSLVSDLRYTRDFPQEMEGIGDPSLENTLSLTKNTEFTHTSAGIDYYVNQLKSNPLEGNADAVHRFPEIKQSGIERSLFGSRLFYRWDVNYVNFTREDFAFDDVVGTGPNRVIDRARGQDSTGVTQAGSGTFQPGVDVLRTGQRLDLKPEISLPFRLGKFLDVLPSVQFRHTQYAFNVTNPTGSGFETGPSRQYLRGRLALRTQMSRVYEDDIGERLTADGFTIGNDSRLPATDGETPAAGIFQALQAPVVVKKSEKIKHEIEPEIAIQSLPFIQQTNSPFFGSNASVPIFLDNQPVSNADFYSDKGLQFDYDDRITQRNIVSALVTNRFIRKTWNGETPVYRQIVSIKNGASYEYDKQNGDQAANFSDIFTVVDARLDRFDTNTSVRFFPLHRVVNTSSRARLTDKSGNFFQMSFSQNYLITENVAEAYPLREENIGFAFGFVHQYATIAAALDYLPSTYSPIDLRLKSWSADVLIKPPGNCWGAKASLKYVLGEKAPIVGFDFSYDFSGSI